MESEDSDKFPARGSVLTVQSNSLMRFSCSDCGKSYSSSSNLARHRQSHRPDQDKKSCPHCSKEYSSSASLSMHMRTHTAGCKCPLCGKSLSRPSLLRGHIRTHTGEKPFSCHICNKAFADKSNLRAHVQTHSSDKPFSCAKCGKCFALKSYLSKHKKSRCLKTDRASSVSGSQSQANRSNSESREVHPAPPQRGGGEGGHQEVDCGDHGRLVLPP